MKQEGFLPVILSYLILSYNTAQNMKGIWWNRKGSEKRIGHAASHLIALICQTSLSSHTRLLFGDTHILLLIPKMKNRKKNCQKNMSQNMTQLFRFIKPGCSHNKVIIWWQTYLNFKNTWFSFIKPGCCTAHPTITIWE